MPNINLEQLLPLDQNPDLEPINFTWQCAGESHIGRVRKVNEDAFILSSEQGLWAVADGMGGHSRGDYASKVVVEALAYFSMQQRLSENVIDLEVRLKNAHQICRNTFPGEQVGSTVAALHVYGNLCFFLWAGDSRIYRLRAGTLEQMTTDHTVAQQKCARGELSPLRAAIDPTAHILTRAVGVSQNLAIDLDYTQAQAGDRYLLCSDGLYNDLEHKEIQALLMQGSPQESVRQLIDISLNRGGRDNTTVIVLDAHK